MPGGLPGGGGMLKLPFDRYIIVERKNMILVVFLVYLCFAQVLVFDKDIIEFECFSWDDRNNQEKLKTKVMQFFSLGRWGGGDKQCVKWEICKWRIVILHLTSQQPCWLTRTKEFPSPGN